MGCTMAKIILVEDEEALRRSMRRRLEVERHVILETQSVPVALSLVAEHEPDLVITDINLGQENGIDLVHQLRDQNYRGGVIVITAYGTIDNAVNAVKSGADEFLQKPVGLEELFLAVVRTLDRKRMANRLNLYEKIERFANRSQPLLGESAPWQQTISFAKRTAAAAQLTNHHPAAILLQGEIGTGKQTLARALHAQTNKNAAPFVHIKCFALTDYTTEKELFGLPGSTNPGLFDLATQGSLFLEEIGELPLAFQSRLLALLANQAEAIQDATPENQDTTAHLVVSTSQDLEKRIQQGLFRPDLFFHLNAFAIQLPPLRDRADDVILLAENFLREIASASACKTLKLSPSARNALKTHHWPGNIQELRNVIQRAVLLNTGDPQIHPADLALPSINDCHNQSDHAPSATQARSKFVPITSASQLRFEFSDGPIRVDDLEKELLKAAIRATNGNISKAAKLVGMTRSGLRYRIERHDLRHLIEEMAT